MMNTNTTTKYAYYYLVVVQGKSALCTAYAGTIEQDLDRIPYSVEYGNIANADESHVVLLVRGKLVSIVPILKDIDVEKVPVEFVNGGLDKTVDELTK